jgi:hypothetical protein
LAEESGFVKELVILLYFVHGENRNEKVQDRLDVLVSKSVLIDTLACHLIHDVLKMELGKSLHFVSVKIILLLFLWGFAIR